MKIAFRKLLLANNDIANAVTGIYWKRRPQSKGLPAIVLHLISSPRDYHLRGASGLVESRVQVDCIAETYATAQNVGRLVASTVNAFSGDHEGVNFQRISIENERDDEETESGADAYLYRVSLDLLMFHDE